MKNLATQYAETINYNAANVNFELANTTKENFWNLETTVLLFSDKSLLVVNNSDVTIADYREYIELVAAEFCEQIKTSADRDKLRELDDSDDIAENDYLDIVKKFGDALSVSEIQNIYKNAFNAQI